MIIAMDTGSVAMKHIIRMFRASSFQPQGLIVEFLGDGVEYIGQISLPMVMQNACIFQITLQNMAILSILIIQVKDNPPFKFSMKS